jgi:hypothetical protein
MGRIRFTEQEKGFGTYSVYFWIGVRFVWVMGDFRIATGLYDREVAVGLGGSA